MKKIYNNSRLLVLLSAFLLVVSCTKDDFLDRYPQASPNPENFFVDEASAKQAVIAAYNPWTRNSNMFQRDMVIIFDAMTDDSYWRPSRTSSIQQERWDIRPTHAAINAYWEYAFRSINAANFAIQGIPTSTSPNFTAEQQLPFIAEAHFLRGFSYLFLATFWGDVPLITQPLSNFEEFNQPRMPKEQVFQQILADLEFAKMHLPENQPAQYTGSPTKATAAAYLAKAYLYMKDFPQAEAAARDAIQIAESSGYHLVDDYLSIWSEENEGNPELLFYIAYVHNEQDYGQNMTVQRICRDLPPEFKYIYGAGDGWGYALPQRDLYDAFEPNDPRRGYTIFAPGDTFGIYNRAEAFTYNHEDYDEKGEKVNWTTTYNPGDPVIYDYRWSNTGMNARKMISNLEGLTNVRWSGQDVPQMRLADLYLFLAEALAEQGKAEALDWVNMVRARPSVDMPPKTMADGNLVDIVRHERRVELAMEGIRLYDIMRWGILGEVFGDGTKVKRHFYSDFLPATDLNSRFDAPLIQLPKHLMFPIPQEEIDQNAEINSNNPGYD